MQNQRILNTNLGDKSYALSDSSDSSFKNTSVNLRSSTTSSTAKEVDSSNTHKIPQISVVKKKQTRFV